MILHQKQKEIASSKARFKVVRAGRRSGKSSFEIEDMVFSAVSGRDRNVFYIAPTQTQARDIIWLLLRKRLQGIGQFNEQRLEVSVPTTDGGTSIIKLSGWENRENFRGKSAYRLLFDEVDTMRDFFIGWQDIFRPTLIDTAGGAVFSGTPKKENPNLLRLEKVSTYDTNYQCFHFNTFDNPFLPETERLELIREYEGNADGHRQEILAEHVDNAGALFKYTALVDMFSNTITKDPEKYLVVDIADDGSDKTIFNFFQGLESYRIEQFERLNTESIINQIREYAAEDRIPYSQIVVDAIGVGAGVASSSLLDGIVGYKSSYGAMRTDISPVLLPNVHYTKTASLTTEYANLRSQCVFTLASLVNEHKVACKVQDVRIKERVIEELALYQDVSKGDGKRVATQKDDIKALLGRSPDTSDTFLMRMYFHIRSKLLPAQSEEKAMVERRILSQFAQNESNFNLNDTK